MFILKIGFLLVLSLSCFVDVYSSKRKYELELIAFSKKQKQRRDDERKQVSLSKKRKHKEVSVELDDNQQSKKEKREFPEQALSVSDVKQDQKIILEHKHAVQPQAPVVIENLSLDDIKKLSTEELTKLSVEELGQIAARLQQLKEDQKDFAYTLWPDDKQLKEIQDEIAWIYAFWKRDCKDLRSSVPLSESFIVFQFFHQLLKMICKKEFENMKVPDIAVYVQKTGSRCSPSIWDVFDPEIYGCKAVWNGNDQNDQGAILIGLNYLIELFFDNSDKLKVLVCVLGHELRHLFLRSKHSTQEGHGLSIQEACALRLEEIECDKYGLKTCYHLFSKVDLERQIDMSYFLSRPFHALNKVYEQRLKELREDLKKPYSSFSLKKRARLIYWIYKFTWALYFNKRLIQAGGVYFKNKYLDQLAIFLRRYDHPSIRQRIQYMKQYLKELQAKDA